MAAFVKFDVYNSLHDQVVKSRAVGWLGTIPLFQQNLVYMQYLFWNFDMII